MNFLDFIKTNKQNKENKKEILKTFECCNICQANKTIVDFIKKEIKEKYIESVGTYDTKIGKEHCISELYVTSDPSNICFSFNWVVSDTKPTAPEVYSVSFYENMKPYLKGTGKSNLTINTMGQPLPYLIPLMSYILNSRDLSLTEANSNKLLSKKANEMYIGSLKHKIYEGLSDEVMKETFLYNIENNVFESSFNDIEKFDDASEDWTNYMVNSLNGCYDDVCNCVKGGKSSIDEVEVSISKKQSVIVGLNESERKIDEQLQNVMKGYAKDMNILNLLKEYIPKISPDKITMESKEKAYNYLIDWAEKNEKAKIGIKMLSVCANVFEAAKSSTDFNDEDVIELLNRQMK